MATSSKKSAAHEKGLREGEEEKEMGTEEMDGAKTHSRKRSAKGAKNTKPAEDGMYGKKPMDAECGCMSKGRKGKCDGSCGKSMKDGGYMKKMDSLTPQEYLTACELGIQNRSRTYIRARLDAAERLSGVTGGLRAARWLGAFGPTDIQHPAKNEKKEKAGRRSVGYRDSGTYATGFKVDYAQLGM